MATASLVPIPTDPNYIAPIANDSGPTSAQTQAYYAANGLDSSGNPVTAPSSGITSSASLQNSSDQMNALLQSLPSLGASQQSSIAATGAANVQQIQAQQSAGDANFQQQIQQAQAAESAALGNADVSASQSNPTGTEQMQPFSPYSPGGQAAGLAANSTYSGMKGMLSNQFQQTIGNLQSSQEAFDQQSAANQSTAGAQTQANAVSAAQSMIQNQLSIMNNMVSIAQNSQSLQLQQETNSQNFQVQMANYQLQAQNLQQQNATGMMNTVLSSLSGTGAEGGWSALSPMQQTQMTTLANQAGMPIALVQSMIDQKKATQFTTTTDALGNATMMGIDSSGNVVSQSYVGGGLSPTSMGGMSVLAPYMPAAPGNSNAAVIETPNLSGSGLKSSAIVEAATAQGKTPVILDTTQSATYDHVTSALSGLDQVSQNIQSITTQPQNVTAEVGGYLTNTGKAALQDLNTQIMANNPELISAITGSAGSNSGFAIRTIIGSDSGALINVNQPVDTIMANLRTLASTLVSNGNSLGRGTQLFNMSSYPDLNSGQSSAATGGTSGNASGSTFSGITLPN